MLTANYVVDRGNDNLEMSVKEQKVSFNLFDSTTPMRVLCVKLVTLKKRLLGGNPRFLTFLEISLIFVFMLI